MFPPFENILIRLFDKRLSQVEARLRELADSIHHQQHQLGDLMSTQADLTAKEQTLADAVQAETDALGQLKAALDKSLADIQAEVDALKNQNPSLDLTSLDSSITAAQANLASIRAATGEITAADPGETPAAPSA